MGRVCAALRGARVRFAVVGGYAVALHGAVRGTVDVDVVLHWQLAALRRVEEALASLGLRSRLPVGAEEIFRFRDEYARNRNLVAWSFYNPNDPSEQLDIIITYDLKGKRIQTVATQDGPIPLLSRKDLIAMKQASGRPQDLEDVRALKELR